MAACEPIVTSIVEETVESSIVEETISVSSSEETILSPIAEETLSCPIVEETIQAPVVEDNIKISVECWPGTDFASERVVYVDKNGSDTNTGAILTPFLTIQAAIDAAYARYGDITDSSVKVVILVAPGKYEEQIHSYASYCIKGDIKNAQTEKKAVLLYNTGADADHYPLRSHNDDQFIIENFNIETDTGGTIGILPQGGFSYCNFQGKFIERTEAGNSFSYFDYCAFYTANFELTGINIPGRHNVGISNCWFFKNSWILTSTHTVASTFFIRDCIFKKCVPNCGGDWSIQIKGSHIFGEDRLIVSSSASITLIDSIISCGLHFTSNPNNTSIQSCTYNDAEGYLISGEDITADVEVTGVSYVQNVQQNGISGKIHTVANVVFVGGDAVSRYATIQDAIDSLTSGGVVSLQPGTYTEQIHSKANIIIQGLTNEGVPAVKSTIIYNTGVDAAHYPLRGEDNDYFVCSDITIKTDAGGVIGKLSSSKFTGVVFQNGHFIEATANQTAFLELANCSFKDSMAFNLIGAGSGGMRAMTIIGCYFGDHTTHQKLESTNTATLVIIKNTIFHNFYPDIGGDWKVEFSNSHIFGTSRIAISTTNKISFIQCIMSSGLHFTSNPDTIIQLCTFNDGCGYAITGEDITASVTVTDVDYAHNVQQNGISGKIQVACPIRNVGCHAPDRYATMQDAIDSIPASGIAVVRISESFVGLSKFTLPNTGTQITIDGQKKYSLTFTGDIVDITGSQHFSFTDMVKVDGSTIKLNGATAEVSLESNQYILASLVIDAGAFAIVYKASLFGDTGDPAITINSLTTPVIVGYSRVQGATGQPAIKSTVECDEKLKIKFSTLVSGTPATVAPLIHTGANKLDVYVYNTGMSGSWDAATVNNKIGNANLTTDPEITF